MRREDSCSLLTGCHLDRLAPTEAPCHAQINTAACASLTTCMLACILQAPLSYSASLPPPPAPQPRRRCAWLTRRTLFWAFFMALGLAGALLRMEGAAMRCHGGMQPFSNCARCPLAQGAHPCCWLCLATEDCIHVTHQPPHLWRLPPLVLLAAWPSTPLPCPCCAAIGVSAWGMASSLQQTDDTVSDFWGIVRDAQSRVRRHTGCSGDTSWCWTERGALRMALGVCSRAYALVRHTRHGCSQSGLVCSIHSQVHYTTLALQNMRGEAVELQQASTVLSDNQQGEEGVIGGPAGSG